METPTTGTPATETLRLRGTSVLAAPLVIVAIMALTVSVASLVWVAFRCDGATPAEVAWIVLPASVGFAALAAIRGCFVEISPNPASGDAEGGERADGEGSADGIVRDVVGWITVRRLPRGSIETARVRRGVWRLYVIETVTGDVIKLVGSSPLQFPSTLLSDAREHDLADLDLLLGAPDPG